MRIQFVATLLISFALIVSALSAAAVSAEESDGPNAGDTFRDCADCPEMVVVPAGEFMMGSGQGERNWFLTQGGKQEYADREAPHHRVSVGAAFAIGRNEVTKGQFAAFVRETGRMVSNGCWYYEGKWKEDTSGSWREPGFEQGDDEPVVCVSWDDAKAYTEWISEKTGHSYRLPSEAEWEYAARGGTNTARHWGEDRDNDHGCGFANVTDKAQASAYNLAREKTNIFMCRDGYVFTSPVGSFSPNAFGLYDMLGNVWEWVEDCWNESYAGAPSNTNVWTAGDCRRRVQRGGSWSGNPWVVRSASRFTSVIELRISNNGFRIARTLPFSVNKSPNVTEASMSELAILIVPLDQQMTTTKNSNVRSGPSTSYDRLQTLSSGAEVSVTGRTEDGDWYRIALAGGRVGYVFNKLLKEKRAGPDVVETFRDCADCPEMVAVPAGEFTMGSARADWVDDAVSAYERGDYAAMFRAALPPAEQGDAGAQAIIGSMYDNGVVVPENHAEAIKWYRKSARQGNATAQYNLGIIYRNGRDDVPQNYAEAAKWYRKAAEQGDVGAQNNLGRMYANGWGVPENDAEAVKWYRKAAEKGHARAQINLGSMHADGHGVPQNYVEAVKWYRKAAEQNDADAQAFLGLMYGRGAGVPVDYIKAHMWLSLAKEQGHKQAVKGLVLVKSQMTPADISKAQALASEWLEKHH
jgi:formylglycine-generating enzyme